MILLLALFVLLQAIDIWTTLRAFRRNPLAYEGNPLVRWAIGTFGKVPALTGSKLLAGGVVLWLGLAHPRDPIALGVIGSLCAFYVWIVVNNWRKGS